MMEEGGNRDVLIVEAGAKRSGGVEGTRWAVVVNSGRGEQRLGEGLQLGGSWAV